MGCISLLPCTCATGRRRSPYDGSPFDLHELAAGIWNMVAVARRQRETSRKGAGDFHPQENYKVCQPRRPPLVRRGSATLKRSSGNVKSGLSSRTQVASWHKVMGPFPKFGGRASETWGGREGMAFVLVFRISHLAQPIQMQAWPYINISAPFWAADAIRLIPTSALFDGTTLMVGRIRPQMPGQSQTFLWPPSWLVLTLLAYTQLSSRTYLRLVR